MRRASLKPDLSRSLEARLRAAEWRLLDTGCASGAANMALDEWLLDEAVAGRIPPTLRFYGWTPPAVSLGRFQEEGGFQRVAADRRGFEVVRRPTGGRAVLHQHEVTYSVVLPPGLVGSAGVRSSYDVLVGALNRGLASLLGRAPGAPSDTSPVCETGRERSANCFAAASACDTLVPEGKLVGSAQVRREGALLQHGSILLDADRDAWADLFGSPGRLVTLRDILGVTPPHEAVIAAVVNGFRSIARVLVPGELAGRERETLAPLARASGTERER